MTRVEQQIAGGPAAKFAFVEEADDAVFAVVAGFATPVPRAGA